MPIEQIHPFAVHFPIVFVLCLFVLDLYARLKSIPLDGRGGVANLSAGLAFLAGVGATIAAAFGAMALEVAASGGVPQSTTGRHEALGGSTASALAVWGLVRAFVWYRKIALSNAVISGFVIVEFLLAGLIVATSYYGGQLVYDFGVNVSIPPG